MGSRTVILSAAVSAVVTILFARLQSRQPSQPPIVAAPVQSVPPPAATQERVIGDRLADRLGHVVAVQRNRPALRVSGDAVFAGTIVVDGDILLADSSLSTVLRALQLYAQMMCFDQPPCVHGLGLAFADCSCLCDDEWRGPMCSEHTCFDRGQWDPDAAACMCSGSWLSEGFCRFQWCDGQLVDTDCPPVESDALTVDDILQCVGPRAPCGPRNNWGHPHRPDDSFPAGLCPGGFRRNEDGAVYILASVLLCDDTDITTCQYVWDATAQRCCAPDSSCARPTCADSVYCCLQMDTADACIAAGCMWCSSRICMSRRVANATQDCQGTLPGGLTVGTGSNIRWRDQAFRCTPQQCPDHVVETYLRIWDTQRDTAMAIIAQMTWPTMAADAWGHLRPFRIRIGTDRWLAEDGGGRLITTRYQSTTWVAVYPLEERVGINGSAVQWVSASSMQRVSCVVDPQPSELVRLQLTGTFSGAPLAMTVTADDRVCGLFIVQAQLGGAVVRDAVHGYMLQVDAGGGVGWSADVGTDVSVI
jgi:hypothetical protein